MIDPFGYNYQFAYVERHIIFFPLVFPLDGIDFRHSDFYGAEIGIRFVAQIVHSFRNGIDIGFHGKKSAYRASAFRRKQRCVGIIPAFFVEHAFNIVVIVEHLAHATAIVQYVRDSIGGFRRTVDSDFFEFHKLTVYIAA